MFEVEATSGLFTADGREVPVANQTTISMGTIAQDRQVQELARQLGGWVEQARDRGGAKAGMFDRSVYVVPDNPYHQMRVARQAVREDDIVSGLADATEALAFDGGLKWESADADEADIFNQISADLNLDGKIREMWRELFSVDQVVVAKMWGWVDYSVRGTTDAGNKKKKKKRVWAPTDLTILRPENVVPTGWGPLRQDSLAWSANTEEVGVYDLALTDQTSDPLMRAFFTGLYAPGTAEEAQLAQWGVDTSSLLAMNPDWVFRHCTTRPDYEKFPDLRLRSVFALLDLKRQLIASDRAMLVGAANYILLIRKGSDNAPATQTEVDNLKAGYNFLAKLPVIISDHRLEIDVIAPKLDFVLKKEAYEAIDHRILTRLLATFTAPTVRAAGDGTSVFSDVLASGIQSRRHMLKRALEKHIGRAIVEHPKNEGLFEEKPTLVFTPRNVTVGISQSTLSAYLALRTQREMSRDTILEYLGLDEATEAQRLEFEEKNYDQVFKTQVPFSASNPAPAGPSGPSGASGPVPKNAPVAPKTPNSTPESPSVSGRRGGRPTGGGTSPQSPASTARPRGGNGGNPTTRPASKD